MLALRRERRTQREIVKELNVSEHQVRVVAEKCGIKNRAWAPSAEQLERITDLALAHQHSGAAICRMVCGGKHYKAMMKIAHAIGSGEKFLSGPKLDSYLPMRWKPLLPPRRDATETAYLKIVEIITRFVGPELQADLPIKVRLIVGLYFRSSRKRRLPV